MYVLPLIPLVAKTLKFLTVLGTTSPNSPMTILPVSCFPTVMSKNARSVTLYCSDWKTGTGTQHFFADMCSLGLNNLPITEKSSVQYEGARS